MSRKSLRSTRLLSWRYLRWGIAIPTLPLAWWACTSHPLTQPVPAPEMQTDIYISVAPIRKLDLVFAIDNSPSMAPKQQKLKDQFPGLIDALKDPGDGNLPDLRVAIIDSDLGTGGAWTSGSCGPSAKTGSNYGDLGYFQMIGAEACGVSDSSALWLEYAGGKPLNYKGDIKQVFQCLASNLGTMGCGEEHQLQALEFALIDLKLTPQHAVQQAMLRQDAYLGIVFLTDEDDCSAATNDGMFGEAPGDMDLKNESASLRCATRAHKCSNRNLTEDPGYPVPVDKKDPFSAAFSACKPRTDNYCPNPTDGKDATDTSKPTECVPLKDISHMADEIKGLKGGDLDKILVAGIFGWPSDNLPGQADIEYRIDKVPNPNSADKTHPQVWDLWPICYDPDHFSAADKTSFSVDHAGWGATPGLRVGAFIDEFNGLKFSICEKDYKKAMSSIGDALAKKLSNLCVDYKLLDTDVSTKKLDPDCRVVYRTPKYEGNKVTYEESPDSLPQCDEGATMGNVPKACWQLTSDFKKCEKNGQLIQVLRTADQIADGPLEPGTKVGMQCRTCIPEMMTLITDKESKEYKQCHYDDP